MSLPIEFLSGADGDLQTIFNRFEEYREGFGVEFLIIVDVLPHSDRCLPEIAPLYVDNIRRQVMQTFPFGIFYEPRATRVLVTAILDLRQDQRAIFRRLQP